MTVHMSLSLLSLSLSSLSLSSLSLSFSIALTLSTPPCGSDTQPHYPL